MNDDQQSPSDTIDVTRPNMARMCNYYLGGKDHYAADRKACERLLAYAPSTQTLILNSRRFLTRVIRCLAQEHGVRQFLDIGAGLPARDNVHDIARRYAADATVIYVDNDPMVAAYGRALLEDNDRTVVVQADLRAPDDILDEPRVASALDLCQPVAVLYISVLHCIPDSDDPAGLIERTTARLCTGSMLAISHLVSADPATRRVITDFIRRTTAGRWGAVRQTRDVERFFTGLDVLPPGLVDVATWRNDGPQPSTGEWLEYGGVGRVR